MNVIVPVIVVRLLFKLYFFLDMCSKNSQIQNFMNICPLGAKVFHADRQTNGQT